MCRSKNVLHVCAALDGGGIEKVIFNQISYDNSQMYEYTIIKHTEKRGILEDALELKGCTIFYVPKKRQGVIQYIKNMKKIIQEQQIDIFHCHQGHTSYLPLMIAKFCDVSLCIAHGHTCYYRERILAHVYRVIATFLTILYADVLLACSKEVKRWMWHDHKKAHVILNGVASKDYAFDQEKRDRYRNMFQLEDCFVIGCVSRLHHDKNHLFLLQIMKELLSHKANAMLVMVGNGEMKEKILEMSEQLELSSHVLLLDGRNDIADIMNMFDVFALPSLYEGLGIVYLEAQLNALPTFASDLVPRDSKRTDLIQYLPLSQDIWVQALKKGKRRALTMQEQKSLMEVDVKYQIISINKRYEEALI